MHNHKLVAKVETDDHGRYQIRGIRPGIHVVQTVGQERACRFWAADTAPPAAKHGLILASQSVVRGQCGLDCGEGCCSCGESCGGGSGLFGAGKGMTVGVGLFAAAVAVTLATTLDDDDDNFGTGTPPASP